MAKVKVEIIKLAGETGLKMPGSILQMEKQRAKLLESKGILTIVTKKKKIKDVIDR